MLSDRVNQTRWAFLITLTLICGCKENSKAPDMGGTDGKQIASLVEETNEAAGDSKKLEALFKSGVPLPDANLMTKYGFSVVGKPTVYGTSATAKVRIDSAEGQKLAEVEWAFEKNGEVWKITNAPLP